MEFRNYQTEIIQKAKGVLEAHRFVYLSMEVRTGKTLTALGVAEKLGITNLLFVTKKKAIGSIEASLVSAEKPGRAEVLRSLAAAKELPTVRELEELDDELLELLGLDDKLPPSPNAVDVIGSMLTSMRSLSDTPAPT